MTDPALHLSAPVRNSSSHAAAAMGAVAVWLWRDARCVVLFVLPTESAPGGLSSRACCSTRSGGRVHSTAGALHALVKKHEYKKSGSDITPDPGGHRPQRPYVNVNVNGY